MKFLAAQITYLLQDRTARRNIGFLLKFVLLLVGVIALYSVLFHFIMEQEGQAHSWITGVYWTLTVMSTLGFGDITFSGDLGRVFSIVVLMSGIIFLLVMLPFTFIQFFYAPWLEAQNKALAPRELPPGTHGHVIIIGPDSTALNLAQRLRQYGHEHVLLCPDAQTALALHDQGYSVAVGDHDDSQTYRKLRVEGAAMVVALDSDVRNTSITFTVREACAAVPIVAKADQEESVDILTLAGSTHVFQFTRMLGQTLARRTLGANMRSGIIGRFDELMVAETPVMRSNLVGRTLRQCGLREAVGVNVVGVWERGRFTLPDPDLPLTGAMVLVLAGTLGQIETFDSFAGVTSTKDGPVVILGGGRVGQAAAEQLHRLGLAYRVVEKKPRQTGDGEHLVAGNAADLDVLERAGIREAPSVFITTHDDDMNTYLTIYCRRLRPDIQIISRATLDRNIGILHSAGADLVISHASLVANTVVNLLSPGKVLMLTEGLNIFRMPLPPQLEGTTLMGSDIRAATGCSVVAVGSAQGLEINPDPARVLAAGDELILIGTSASERRFLDRFPQAAG
ncbi:potassium channel family protein [Desulfocurvus vexinensis]|uniref:potassium channel family protein n=1 Tax=Desulfocurvus vexinensis TaxID=399548 RepID=UPI000491ED95|nr:NAD-binding protein [Desulfocurvus vexinensis]